MYEPKDDNVFEVVGRDLYKWKYFYPDSQEIMPKYMSEALGKYVATNAYVDANHAGNMATRRSHYGIIIYINNANLIWYSKHQNTVEASSFGPEFVALRITTETIEALRYKFKMLEYRLKVLKRYFVITCQLSRI